MNPEFFRSNDFLKEAKRQGVNITYRTLRYYVTRGLLPPPIKKSKYTGWWNSSLIPTIKAIQELTFMHGLKLSRIKDSIDDGISPEDLLRARNERFKCIPSVNRFLQLGFTLEDLKILKPAGEDQILCFVEKTNTERLHKTSKLLLWHDLDVMKYRRKERIEKFKQEIIRIEEIMQRLINETKGVR